MESIQTYLAENLTIPSVQLFLLGILLIYKLFSHRFKNLPQVPVGLLILYVILRLILDKIPEFLDRRVVIGIDVAATVALYCALVKLVFALVIDKWMLWKKRTVFPKITRDLLLVIIYSIIILVILRTRGGVNLAGLITTSAVLTAVIGFAAQDTLGNLFAGLTIQIDHPYRIGDWVQFKEYSGEVVGVSWKSTRLKTFEDELVLIPNLEIVKSSIKNMSLPTPRHVMKIDVGVDYNIAPNKVRQVMLAACNQEPRVLKSPPPSVRLTNFGESSIVYQLRIFYDGYGSSPEVRASVMDRIWYAFKRADISIPYPIRDVHHRHIERKYEAGQIAEMRKQAIQELSFVPILKPLLQEHLEIIAKFMLIETYGDGEIIVRQGEGGDTLYIIHSGVCDIEVSSEGGQATATVATLGARSFFGEMALLTGEPRSATVRARGDVQVFVINKNIFKAVIVAHPEISEDMARILAKRYNERQAVSDKLAQDLTPQTKSILAKIKAFFGV